MPSIAMVSDASLKTGCMRTIRAGFFKSLDLPNQNLWDSAYGILYFQGVRPTYTYALPSHLTQIVSGSFVFLFLSF